MSNAEEEIMDYFKKLITTAIHQTEIDEPAASSSMTTENNNPDAFGKELLNCIQGLATDEVIKNDSAN